MSLLGLGIGSANATLQVRNARDGPTIAIAPNVSTLGIGADLVVGLTRHLAIRAGGHLADVAPTFESDGMAYTAALAWRNAQVLLDVHPIGNAFRLSAGIVWNNNHATVVAISTDSLTLGSTLYHGGDLARVSGAVTFRSIAPYVGLGMATAGVTRVTFDFGVLFQGPPRSAYVATTALPDSWRSYFDQAVTDEVTHVREQVNGATYLRFYPVVSVGLSTPIR